mmetsp:Transcript_45208/g.86453  ORF Transcript_45208/g.86453 Transcript_45208/m.86453 type:complete len:286 (+) Transcript_45208:2638-3495(+)
MSTFSAPSAPFPHVPLTLVASTDNGSPELENSTCPFSGKAAPRSCSCSSCRWGGTLAVDTSMTDTVDGRAGREAPAHSRVGVGRLLTFPSVESGLDATATVSFCIFPLVEVTPLFAVAGGDRWRSTVFTTILINRIVTITAAAPTRARLVDPSPNFTSRAYISSDSTVLKVSCVCAPNICIPVCACLVSKLSEVDTRAGRLATAWWVNSCNASIQPASSSLKRGLNSPILRTAKDEREAPFPILGGVSQVFTPPLHTVELVLDQLHTKFNRIHLEGVLCYLLIWI